eukprot:5707610-Heterocapsa_arctica.AAC.1
MADDIESSEGFDAYAARLPDKMAENPLYRRCVNNCFNQFFGSTNPTEADMYTHRGMLAAEVKKQQKLAEGSALLGLPYVAPKKVAAAPL